MAFNIEGTHQTYYIEKTEALLMRKVLFDNVPQSDRLRDFVFLTSKMIGI